MRAVALLSAALLLCACGQPEAEASAGAPPPAGCSPGELALEESTCLAAGWQPDGCPAGESFDAGTCVRAGVRAEACMDGFAGDGASGCEPILPELPCASGEMAVPGETSCRAVAPCGDAYWGEVEIDEMTELVDASYVGGSSDGSADKPWTTIQQAVDAAASGALVAVAAGTYVESVFIGGSPVRLRGRCPGLVEIVGTEASTIMVAKGAGGTEIANLAIRGGGAGIAVSGSDDVRLERLWVHDTGDVGLNAQDVLGPPSVTLSGSLFERTRKFAVFAAGAEVTIEDCAIVDTESAAGSFGRGINAVDNPSTNRRSSLSLRRSVLERNHESAILVGGSDAVVEASVIRDTVLAADGSTGKQVAVQGDEETGERSEVTLRGCVLERYHEIGVYVAGSGLRVESTVVRDAEPEEQLGRAIESRPSATGRTSLELYELLIEGHEEVGIVVSGSDAVLDLVLVQDPRPVLGKLGRGISVQHENEPLARSNVTIRASRLARNSELGMLVGGSDALLEGVAIEDTQPAWDLNFGRGLSVQQGGVATIRFSAVERSSDAGVLVAASTAVVEATAVIGTRVRAKDGLFGDGLAVDYWDGAADVTVTGSRIATSARAGVSTFGAEVSLGSTWLECNAIDLDGERWADVPYALDDLGGNACGCEAAAAACQVQTRGLSPPEPMPLPP